MIHISSLAMRRHIIEIKSTTKIKKNASMFQQVAIPICVYYSSKLALMFLDIFSILLLIL